MSHNKLTNILVTILIVLVAILVFLQLKQQVDMKSGIANAMSKIEIKNGINGSDGYTPMKGVDYKDGTNGKNGKDSLSTHTIEKQVITKEVIKEVPIPGENGNDGLTPILQCNTERNRWEVKYSENEIFRILGGKQIKCTVEEL